MVDEVVKAEATLVQRHIAGIGPVADVDVVVLQEAAHGAAQQGRMVARQRGHDQHGGGRAGLAGGGQGLGIAAEAPQLDPGGAPYGVHLHRHGMAADLDLVDAPIRLAVAAGHVGDQVGGGIELARVFGAAGGISGRTPEITGRIGGQPQGDGGVVSGFV